MGAGQATVGRKHNSGEPPIALIFADTSPSSVRPVMVTENIGACPVSAIGNVARSMILLPGTVTFVQAAIAAPEEFLTLNVADVYVTAVTSVKDFHA